uniref:C2H2-type domain-containing protein n=1 Tax=Trichuris muris TaxID=70415 RepID=A0A5S6QEK7_TRIMR
MSKNAAAYMAPLATCSPLSSSSSSPSSSSSTSSLSTASSSSSASSASSSSSSSSSSPLSSSSSSSPNQQTAMILKCVGLACDCPNFVASTVNTRCCSRCHHSWLSHVSDLILMLKTSPYESLGSSTSVSISPSAVFDLVFMVLYGSQAIPVQLKILLDRLLSVVDANTRLSLLDSFGWSVDDYARGYILQDRLGHKLLFWNMCSRYEEQLILPQFLRFAETKPLVMKMMGLGQSPCLSPFGGPTDIRRGQQDLNPLANSTLMDVAKSRITGLSSDSREGDDGGNFLLPYDSSEAIMHANEQSQYHMNIGFSEQDLVDIVGRTCSKLIKSQNGTVGSEHEALTTLSLQNSVAVPDLSSVKWKSSSEGAEMANGSEFIGSNGSRGFRSSRVAEQNIICSKVSNTEMNSQGNDVQKQGFLSVVAAAAAAAPGEGFSYPAVVPSGTLEMCLQGSSLYYSKTLRNIRRAASRRFHPWNLSSLGTNPLTGKKRVQCRVCLKTFCDKGALKIHISAVHLREMHKCTIEGCNMMFSSRRSRNRHSANPNPKLHSTVLRRNSGPLPGCRVISPPCAVGNFQPFVGQCSASPNAQVPPSYDEIGVSIKSGGSIMDVRTSSSPLERCSSRKRKSDHPTKLEVSNAEAPKKETLDELTTSSSVGKEGAEEIKMEVNDRSLDFYDSASSFSSACSSVDNSTTASQRVVYEPTEMGEPKMLYRGPDVLNGDSDKDDSPSNLLALRIRELCNLRQCYNVSASQFGQQFLSSNGDEPQKQQQQQQPHIGRRITSKSVGSRTPEQNGTTVRPISADSIRSVNVAVEKDQYDCSQTAIDQAKRESTAQSNIVITRCKTAGGGTIEIPINEKNPRQCSACGKMFQNHFSVKTHYQNVHLKVMHGCTVQGCTAAFPSKRSRDRHSANQNLHRRLLNGGNEMTEQEIIGGAKEPFPFSGLVSNCTSNSSPFFPADLINSGALAVASAAFYGALRSPVIPEESLLPTLSMPVVSPYLAGQLAAAGFPQEVLLQQRANSTDGAQVDSLQCQLSKSQEVTLPSACSSSNGAQQKVP